MREAIGPEGQRFDAATAPKRGHYRCVGCGGRVFLRRGATYAPAFAHYEGEGVGCDLYFHGERGSGPSLLDHEEQGAPRDSDKLTLLLRTTPSTWSIVLGIDEMSAADARSTTLAALRQAELQITAGDIEVARLSAADLRHGVRRADAEVPPSAARYRVRCVGTWPQLAFGQRDMQLAGLNARGTLFKEAHGEWVRVRERAPVRWGQALFLAAAPASTPPTSCIVHTMGAARAGGDKWQLWRLSLPSEPATDVAGWIADIGHEVVSPRWRLSLVSVPRGFSGAQNVQLYAGDPLLASLDGPPGEASATLTLETRGRATAQEVEQGGRTFALARPPIGHGALRLEAEDDVATAFEVIPRPTAAQLQADFMRLPRLVVHFGQTTFAPGRHILRLRKDDQGALFTIETGTDGVRVALMIQSTSGRRVLIGVTPSEATRALMESFAAEDVEGFRVDAGALGACVVSCTLDPTTSDDANVAPRLAGWLSAAAHAHGRASRSPSAWIVRAASHVPALRGASTSGVSTISPALSALLRRCHPERGS